MNLGYTNPLYILPFDHRSTFLKAGFSTDEIISAKKIIYEAFELAVSNGVPKEDAAILVDEEFGDSILKDAKNKGYATLLTTEKSGEQEFVFEYGDDFGHHIDKYRPTFAKALVRCPESLESIDRLKKLSDFCHNNGYKFLVELLANGDKSEVLSSIVKFQESGVEPDVWKVEGYGDVQSYREIVEKAREEGRLDVGIVILGRGEGKEIIEKWIRAGSKVDGIIGFAVGRTIFWQPILDFKSGKISEKETIGKIAKGFEYFYNIFKGSSV